MTSFGSATFINIKSADGTMLNQWQSYEIGKTYQQWSFLPFDIGAITEASSGSASTLQVQFPITQETVALLRSGITGNWLGEVFVRTFEPLADGGIPPNTTLVAAFYGEIVGGVMTESSVTVELGSRLDSVEAQVPARVFTTELVGNPPKL